MNDQLESIRERFQEHKKINWSHAKYRYEVEIPHELVEGKKKPNDFEFTSQKKDYQRFHTREILNLVEKLEVAEEELKEAFVPFLTSLFQKFQDQRYLWDTIVSIISELDCLISLAIASG